jgi:hypothetical protein
MHARQIGPLSLGAKSYVRKKSQIVFVGTGHRVLRDDPITTEPTFDGTSKRRKAIVGTVEAFPTEASALKAAKALRIDANQQTPHFDGGPETVAELVAHYRLKELVGENQGTQVVFDARRVRKLSERLDSSSLGGTQT